MTGRYNATHFPFERHRQGGVSTYILLLTFCLLGLSPKNSFAQITQVSGTVTDPSGIPYANATIKAQLVLAGGAAVTGQPTVTNSSAASCAQAGFGSAPCQVPFQGTVGPLGLSSSGTYTINLQTSGSITPSGTQWLFTVTTPGNAPPLGSGAQICTTQQTITGSTQTVNLSCPALSNVPTLNLPLPLADLTPIPVQLAGGANTTATTVNASSTAVQPIAAACGTTPCFAAGVLNTLGKTFDLEAVGTFATGTTSTQVLFGLAIGASNGLQFVAASASSSQVGNWYAKITCVVTATGSSGTLACFGLGSFLVNVITSPVNYPQSATLTSVNLTGGITPQIYVQFTAASTSNTATQNAAIARQLN